jgi:hypothetical protein
MNNSLSLECTWRQETPPLRESHFREEMNRQIGNLLEIGVHKELGLSKLQYRRGLPRLYVPQNGIIRPDTDIVLIDPRVNKLRLRDRLGIEMTLHPSIHHPPVKWRGPIPSMDRPHWFFWEKKFLRKDKVHIEAYMRGHWRHLMDFEKVYHYIQFPMVALQTEFWEIRAGRVTYYQPWGGVF